jgi:hypothetical protein
MTCPTALNRPEFTSGIFFQLYHYLYVYEYDVSIPTSLYRVLSVWLLHSYTLTHSFAHPTTKTKLYTGRKSALNGGEGDLESVAAVPKLNDVKAARVLASEITDAGATLYDLLANERTLSKKRNEAARFLEGVFRIPVRVQFTFYIRRFGDVLMFYSYDRYSSFCLFESCVMLSGPRKCL